MILLWLAVGVLAVAVFLLLGAAVEMFRSLEQIRADTGVNDSIVPLDINRDVELESIGLPSELNDRETAVLLFLSDHCGTCEVIANEMNGRLPTSTWLLLQTRNARTASDWLARYELHHNDRTIYDYDGEIAEALNLNVTPSVVRIRKGTVVTAHTMPSARRFRQELQWLGGSPDDQPKYHRPMFNGNRVKTDQET